MREYRGTLTSPGRDSPYRSRPVDENLKLFEAMSSGDLADGDAVLRLKIDMASPNMNMRDPSIYRIKREVGARSARDRREIGARSARDRREIGCPDATMRRAGEPPSDGRHVEGLSYVRLRALPQRRT